jgi:hypothetical protein
MKYFARLLAVALLSSFALFTAGCGADHHAQLRVVHASPDAPNVDVLVDGKIVLTNVPYETASKYLTVSAGSRKIEVRATGGSADVISATASLSTNKPYTVLAVDFLANIAPLVLADDNTPPASGQIKLRLVHASPSAGPVDIYVEAPGTDITKVDPTLSNVPFKAVSAYLSVPAGSYEVFVTPTGSKVIAIDSGSVTLNAGQIRTAVALDAPGGGAPLTAIVLADLN